MRDGRLVHRGAGGHHAPDVLREVYDIDIRIEEIDGNRIGVYFA